MSEEILHLGNELHVDPNMLLARGVIAGMPGTGKSSTAVVLLEEAGRLGVNSLVVAPTDDWWGIGLSADGERPGLDHVRFGGDRGDVPLEPSMGRGIARLVADGMPALVVVDGMTTEHRARLVADLAEETLAVNRRPLLVVVDEEHYLAPRGSVGGSEERARCLAALIALSASGRKPAKIGHYAITQRLARLHTDVRELAEVVIVHKLKGGNDVGAARGLVEDFLEDPAAWARIKALEDGEAFVVADRYGVRADAYRIRRKQTFDSSASGRWDDDADAHPEPTGRSTVDLAAIERQLGEALEEARDHDPSELKARAATAETRIRELEQQLADANVGDGSTGITSEDLARAEQAAAEAAERARVWEERARDAEAEVERRDITGALRSIGDDAQRIVDHVVATLRTTLRADDAVHGGPSRGEGGPRLAPPARPEAQAPAGPRGRPNGTDGGRGRSPGGESDPSSARAATGNGSGRDLPRAAADLAETLAAFPAGLPRERLALLTGRKPRGGSWNTAMKALQEHGIAEDRGDVLVPTDAAHHLFPDAAPLVGDALVAVWREKLGSAARDLFDALVGHPGTALTHDDLGRITGRAPRGGSWNTAVKQLKTSGLVVEVVRGALQVNDDLWKRS